MSTPHHASGAIVAGSAEFKRSNRALFAGGFSTFALLYCVQPLMPILSADFHLTPAQSSLSLSISTGALAISLVLTSAISDRYGRKPLMVLAMLVAAVMTLLCAFAHTYPQLLVLRALLGAALGGMPAIAMAYLGEEVAPASLGLSMGLYIAGSAFGGMAGRVLSSVLSDFLSWRPAMAVIGLLGILAAAEFWRSLPASKNFKANHRGFAALPAGIRQHLADPGLPWLYGVSFLLMGTFVSMYNYIAYHLLGAPFFLRQSIVGAIAFMYLIGIFSSVWAGKMADKHGRRNVLWAVLAVMLVGLLITLVNSLLAIVPGMFLFTFGFFASHSVASSWVSRRAKPPKALASALYLFFYYLGSSVIGSLSGVMWGRGNWAGVVTFMAVTLGLAVLVALKLRGLAPVGQGELAMAAN